MVDGFVNITAEALGASDTGGKVRAHLGIHR